jgi:death on curing protein
MTKRVCLIPKYWLTLADCERLFSDFKGLIDFDEPIPPFNTRFYGRLEAILESVRQTYGGKFLNSSVVEAAAAYLNQLIRGHPFRNGNKRLAVMFTHNFLLKNGLDFVLSSKELFAFAVVVARAGEVGRNNEETKKLCRHIIEEHVGELTI